MRNPCFRRHRSRQRKTRNQSSALLSASERGKGLALCIEAALVASSPATAGYSARESPLRRASLQGSRHKQGPQRFQTTRGKLSHSPVSWMTLFSRHLWRAVRTTRECTGYRGRPRRKARGQNKPVRYPTMNKRLCRWSREKWRIPLV
jgi:hypothetical protein